MSGYKAKNQLRGAFGNTDALMPEKKARDFLRIREKKQQQKMIRIGLRMHWYLTRRVEVNRSFQELIRMEKVILELHWEERRLN